jgi:hypothetical protein
MSSTPRHADRRGAALVLALLMSIAVVAMATGAIMVSSGAQLTTRYSAREASMQAAANGGLEIIRDSINHGIFDSLLPANAFTTLESNGAVYDAFGAVLPRYTRSLYIGRTGGRTGGAATAGQYGSNFASGLSVISDARGAVAARRLLMTQESWSKFAVAINDYTGSAPYGCGSSIQGPLHSNNVFKIQSGCTNPKTLFTGPVTVVGSILNQSSGNFTAGVQTGVSAIDWPTPARIQLMQQYAQDADAVGGDYDLTSRTNGSSVPGLRIEFLSIDTDASGTIDWDEGYMRVWQPANTSDSVLAFATGRLWPNLPWGHGTDWDEDPNLNSRTCGARVTINNGAGTQWYSAREIWHGVKAIGGTNTDARNGTRWSLSDGGEGSRPSEMSGGASNQRCYLGGDPYLYPATRGTDITPGPTLTNEPASSNRFGEWITRRTGPHASAASRSDAAYLIPLGANPNFKGVIFVTGDVAVSGNLRGRASIFATGNIVLADDLLYHNAPGTKCDVEGDILGAIATINVIMADNSVQMPFMINDDPYGGFDDTPADEQYNMFIMAAGDGTWGTGNLVTQGLPYSGWPGPARPYSLGPSGAGETCGAGAPGGCIRVTGGIAMGRMDFAMYQSGNTWGYASAHSYDPCGAVNPPPYFPTTGRFIESRYYEVDPVWLNGMGVASYFASLRAQ